MSTINCDNNNVASGLMVKEFINSRWLPKECCTRAPADEKKASRPMQG